VPCARARIQPCSAILEFDYFLHVAFFISNLLINIEMAAYEFQPEAARQSLDNFDIAVAVIRRVRHVKTLWPRRSAPACLTELFDWKTEPDRRSRFKNYGFRIRDLFFTPLGLSDQDRWEFSRLLGFGGFGAAALFNRQSEVNGATLDVHLLPISCTALTGVDRKLRQ